MPSTVAAVEARGLTKTVQDAAGSLTIVDDINVTIDAGETVAIVGASGSGKSTLLGLLAGLDLPTRGTVHLFGESLFERDEDERARLRARHIGFVFQSFQLLPHMTALENVLLPLELSGRIGSREGVRMAKEVLGRAGLGARLEHYPKHLSGGEQQRVALARAFIGSPSVLFADEPTGSLDVRTGTAVIELMFEMNRERGSTLILVTHDAAIASRCQRRLELDAGRIQAVAPLGTPPQA